jgi:histidine triad (HIT) family protein
MTAGGPCGIPLHGNQMNGGNEGLPLQRWYTLCKMNDCIFCKIVKREVPAYIIDENKDTLVFLSHENHPLVVTKQHLQDVYDLDEHVASAVMIEAVKIAKAVKAGLGCDGVNLVQSNGPAAGQDVFHFHLHIKPRWHNDQVILSWDTHTVQPTLLEATMEQMKKGSVSLAKGEEKRRKTPSN